MAEHLEASRITDPASFFAFELNAGKLRISYEKAPSIVKTPALESL